MSSFAGRELINRVVSHPSEPISITAHENRTIRFLDNKTGMCRRCTDDYWNVFSHMHLNKNFCAGKVVHSMVAHLDAVTCLTTDPKGTYLISGSEYSALLCAYLAKYPRLNF